MTLLTHHLTIANHSLTIRSTAGQEEIERLVERIDSKIRTLSERGVAPLSSALLTALGLADELSRLEKENQRLRAQLQESAEALSLLLEGEG